MKKLLFLVPFVPLGVAGLVGTSTLTTYHKDVPVARKFGTPPKAPRTSGAFQAFEFRKLSWKDESGNIPKGAFQRAFAQRQESMAAQPTSRDSTNIVWTQRGPNNIGGRTRSLLAMGGTTLLAGSVGGGIWRSTNSGSSWSLVSDWLPSLAIGCLHRDPNSPNTVYAGTGEGYFNGDAIGGTGILRSKDGGLTWALMPSTENWDAVSRIAVQPGNSNVILAATNSGLFRSTDAGNNWTQVGGGYYSFQVEFFPNDPTKALVSMLDYDFGTSQWVRKVRYSSDAGVNWTDSAGLNFITGFYSRIEFARAASVPGTVYASVASGGGTIYKSTNYGQTFTLVNTTSGGTGVSWYYNTLWVDPLDANRLVVGSYHLARSTNGGQSFSQISNGYIDTSDPHPDQHGIIPDAGYNGTTNLKAYAVTDGGVYATNNIRTATSGSGWFRLDSNYRATQFYHAAGYGPTNLIAGGTQDNGHLMITNGSQSGVLTFGGDGGDVEIDSANTNYHYGEYVNLQIWRSTNGGLSGSYIDGGISDAGTGNANFIAPFVLDQTNTNRMFAGGRNIWRSTNVKAGTPTWTNIRAGSSNCSTLNVAPNDGNILWVAQNDGQLFKTTNSGAATPTWVTVDNNSGTNPLPNRFIERIIFNPTNSNQVWVTFGGFSPDNVYRTDNGGTTWVDVTGSGVTGLPEAPVRGFAVHPNNPQRLYAGTEVGMFTSSNGGATWSTSDFGPANVSVDDCAFMYNSTRLLVATHGRGLWIADFPSPAANVTGTVNLGGDYVGPKAGIKLTLEFYKSPSGTLASTKEVTLNSSGVFTVDPDVVDTSTNYTILVKPQSHWLWKRTSAITLSTSSVTSVSISLVNGDINQDNSVDLLDYFRLSDSYNLSSGDVGYDAAADLTGDNSVDLLDYFTLSDNYNVSGDN